MQIVGSKKCILINSYNTPRKRGRPKKAAVSLQDHYPAISYSTVDPDEEKTASDSLQKTASDSLQKCGTGSQDDKFSYH